MKLNLEYGLQGVVFQMIFMQIKKGRLIRMITYSRIMFFNFKNKFLIINKVGMPRRNSKWTSQESEILRQLKQQQMKDDIVNWQIIAKIMNQKFPNFFRTSKQCREKYINHLVIQKVDDIYEEWSLDQVKILTQMYQEYGPSWSLIRKSLDKRSQNCIKNKFNTSLRKAANILWKHETMKKSITYKILCSMLNFTNQLKKRIQELGLTKNNESNFFIFRQQILKLCFFCESYDKESILNLITIIKYLNTKIRSFGAFRSACKRKNKFSEKGFIIICSKQNIIKEWNSKITPITAKEMDSQENSLFEDQRSQNQIQNLQFTEMLQFYKNDQKNYSELLSLHKQLGAIVGYDQEKYTGQGFSHDF